MFFRVVCSEGGQDPRGQKAQKCIKTLVFSGIRCASERGFPLSQAEVRHLKNTVWITPFGTLRPLVSCAHRLQYLMLAFFMQELLVESCINSEMSQRFDVKFSYCNRARPQLLRFPHLTKTPLCKPLAVPLTVLVVEVCRSLRDGNKISRQ